MPVNIPELVKKKPLFMSILNITPDSFSDGGKYFDLENAINHAKELINSGFHIIDVGGESTRPGALLITEAEEIKRVLPVIEYIRRDAARSVSTCTISIDTYKSKVAKAALEAGAEIINDVSGLTMDKEMVNVAKDFNCPIVIMHNEGIPARKDVVYNVSIDQIIQWLKKQTDYAMENGIKKENIIIDPGIGFGKTTEENLFIIENLSKFKSLGFPILIGPSRKSFIKAIYGEDADIEKKSKEIVDLCIKNGADIVRVHSF
jgi:dihydropteroate synthase